MTAAVATDRISDAKELREMAKQPPNHGKPWTPQEVKKLDALAEGNTPTRVIGIKLGRTPASIYTEASKKGISLEPPNQRPYGTKKK